MIEGLRGAFKGGGDSKGLVDINEVIMRVTMLLRAEVKKHNIELRIKLNSSSPPYVYGTEVQIQQVIFNLMVNAIEALSTVNNGQRSLRVSSRTQIHGRVLISIDDSGPGIDPKDAEQLFKPFFTTKQHGMGMGLSVCKSIVESHGGKLTVAQGVPTGTSFQIDLPYKRRADL